MKPNALAITTLVIAVLALLVSLINFSDINNLKRGSTNYGRILEMHGEELGKHATEMEKLKDRPRA